MLGCDVTEIRSNLRQLSRRAEASIDVGAAPRLWLSRHDAPHDELVLSRYAGGLQLGGSTRSGHELEQGLHLSFRGSVPHELRSRPTTKYKRKCVHNHGLTSAGLAGNHVESRRELKDQALDEHDVANGQLDKHGRNGFQPYARRGATASRAGRRARYGDTSTRGGLTRSQRLH